MSRRYPGHPGHHHPHGHRPPKHHPPQPRYTYAPATIVPVPVYPQPDQGTSQPTYINNYYYQTPPGEPVRVVDNPLPPRQETHNWVAATGSSAATFAPIAVVAGKEGWDSSPLWVIRAYVSGELVPGKLAVKHKAAYVPHGGLEKPVHNFEVLCAPPLTVRWVHAANGDVPPRAIVGGNTSNGEPLYIGRTTHARSITPGKVHPSHGCLYLSFSGKELPFKRYEVLCRA